MLRVLLILLSLFIITGSVSAKNCHNNGRYNKCIYSYYDCDDDDDDDYKCARRNYKRWAKRCHRYSGCDCYIIFGMVTGIGMMMIGKIIGILRPIGI